MFQMLYLLFPESFMAHILLVNPRCIWAAVLLVSLSRPALCDPMDHSPPGSSVRGDSPGKNTEMGCHSFEVNFVQNVYFQSSSLWVSSHSLLQHRLLQRETVLLNRFGSCVGNKLGALWWVSSQVLCSVPLTMRLCVCGDHSLMTVTTALKSDHLIPSISLFFFKMLLTVLLVPWFFLSILK